MDLYLCFKNNALLFSKRFFIADVFKQMSFEDVFSSSGLFSSNINLTESFALVFKVIEMNSTGLIF